MKPATITSPTIQSLKSKIQSGNLECLELFYQDLKEQGTPIIEPLEHDRDHLLVTLVWQDHVGINDITIIGEVFGGEIFGEKGIQTRLQRLLDTNLYYQSYIVKKDSRSLYLFGINDDGDWFERLSLDPFNKKIYNCPKDEDYPEKKFLLAEQESILEMPNAKPKDYLNHIDNKGTINSFVFRSSILQNERRVWLYKPYQYHQNETYGLCVFTDGFEYFKLVEANTILDNLIDRKEIKPICALFIESTEKRSEELSENEEFLNFIFEELLPFIEQKVTISQNAADNVFIGLSLGGYFAAYVGLHKYHHFGNILCQSPAFWFNEGSIIKKYENISTLPIQFYIEYGYYELVNGLILPAIEQFTEVLKTKDIKYVIHEFTGAHIYLDWQDTLPESLKILLNRYC